MRRLKIWMLKRKAKKAYQAYFVEMQSLSCGFAMGELISGKARQSKLRFNECMDRLAKLDPRAPATRL